jgi:ABC-type branched-subunit amino acid transport system substrate-binding protein
MMTLARYAALVLALAVFVTSSVSAQPKPGAPPYKIGVILPLTGTGASFGEDAQIGLKVALNDANARGGVLGRPVVAIVKDDGGDASTAAKAALELIQEDKVDAIAGPVFSNASAAVLPITNDAKMIQIGQSYLADEGNPAKYPYAFKANPTAASVGEAFPAYFHKLKLTKVAILNVDNLQGNGVANGVTGGLAPLGITLVDRESMASGATDVSAQLDKLHRAGPQALVLAMAYGPDYVTALKGIKEIGWTDVIPMGTSAINFAVVVKSGPPDILAHSYGSGGYRNLTVQCAPPVVKQFQKAISDSAFAGGPITRDIGVMSTTYDSVMIIVDAANGSKSVTSAAMKAYLESHPHPGMSGTYVYTSTAHNGLRPEDYVFVKAALPTNGLAEMAPGQSCK